jgi:hypothetical protein
MNVYLPGKIVQVESSNERPDFQDIPNSVNEFKLDTALARTNNKYYIIKTEEIYIYRHKDDIINELTDKNKKLELLLNPKAGGRKYNRTRRNISRNSAYKNLRKSKLNT